MNYFIHDHYDSKWTHKQAEGQCFGIPTWENAQTSALWKSSPCKRNELIMILSINLKVQIILYQ